MKLSSFAYLARFGIKTVLFRKKDPILGTIILTDKCNLKCKHYFVNNITAIIHPYKQIKSGKPVNSLYFGGGTPALAAGRIKEIIEALQEHFI